MLELDPAQQQLIQRLLAHRLPQVNAIAFGSRVAGWQFGLNPKPYSDLDAALWGLRPADRHRLGEFARRSGRMPTALAR
ncbi:MAG: hypothetical protein IPN53_25715 [Comamonadaceae bacterium]|nr:hypothetical protein [Comamonadaceae bacterium]